MKIFEKNTESWPISVLAFSSTESKAADIEPWVIAALWKDISIVFQISNAVCWIEDQARLKRVSAITVDKCVLYTILS